MFGLITRTFRQHSKKTRLPSYSKDVNFERRKILNEAMSNFRQNFQLYRHYFENNTCLNEQFIVDVLTTELQNKEDLFTANIGIFVTLTPILMVVEAQPSIYFLIYGTQFYFLRKHFLEMKELEKIQLFLNSNKK